MFFGSNRQEDKRIKISVCGKGGSGKSALTNLLASQPLSRGIVEGTGRLLVVGESSFAALTVAEKINGLASGTNKAILALLNKIDSE